MNDRKSIDNAVSSSPPKKCVWQFISPFETIQKLRVLEIKPLIQEHILVGVGARDQLRSAGVRSPLSSISA